jgi:hypothetical protein
LEFGISNEQEKAKNEKKALGRGISEAKKLFRKGQRLIAKG